MRVRTGWPYALLVLVQDDGIIRLSLRDIIDDHIGVTRYLHSAYVFDCEDNRLC